MRRANRRLSSRIDNHDWRAFALDPRRTIPLDELQALHKNEADRRRSIEDKAGRYTLGLTIAAGIAVAGIGQVFGKDVREAFNGTAEIFALGALIAGIAFLGFGGLMSLRAIAVAQEAEWGMEDWIEHPHGLGAESFYVAAIEFNRLGTTIKSNLEAVALDCIRNGLVALVVFLMLVVIFLGRYEPNQAQSSAAPQSGIRPPDCHCSSPLDRPGETER
jgi:hypothetical protein